MKREVQRFLLPITFEGNWSKAESMLKENKRYVEAEINEDGSTMLHYAVGIGRNDFVKKLFSYLNDKQVLQQRSTDGSTALHIAAIAGNKDAAELLVKKNKELLRIKDHNGKEPLYKAYEHMHLDTIGFLLNAVNDDANVELQSSPTGSVHPDDEIGDDVLVAIAKNFPSGLDDWETLIYPCMLLVSGSYFGSGNYYTLSSKENSIVIHTDYILLIPKVLLASLASAFMFICLLILLICYIFARLYFIFWKGAKILSCKIPPIKHIENKKKEWDEANEVLHMVCFYIDKVEYSGSHHPYYTQPILEAACHNAYEVVNRILFSSPEAIQSTDKNGYDIIQLAIINRSEKIYNLIYDIGERKNVYRTCKDSSENNIMHLAGKLAPSSVLNRRTGAALQLQRELQWLQEVEKFVFPSFITQENISKETPNMVFTREHKDLVKEGEQWMKTTAESCSITAALIITIVFAAAITVPGGSNQEKGTPLFQSHPAFIIFAIADAISLFASSTSLLVFLSILTTRFAEKDFLVSLPRRLFIGVFSLLLSTTTMMVAFSATFFLVFCDNKLWMLAPICGLAFIPIAFFVTLQFPLMVDLFRSTYLPIFGKQRQSILSGLTDRLIEMLW
ncbi:putative ankyrin repeat-containing domain, PGG domain, ankyrin repeat-containing domain superfamily [Helianthus debilis subsp. tardiflorus]